MPREDNTSALEYNSGVKEREREREREREGCSYSRTNYSFAVKSLKRTLDNPSRPWSEEGAQDENNE